MPSMHHPRSKSKHTQTHTWRVEKKQVRGICENQMINAETQWIGREKETKRRDGNERVNNLDTAIHS
jgi:hypothetical protein